jgi:hypothetical protein
MKGRLLHGKTRLFAMPPGGCFQAGAGEAVCIVFQYSDNMFQFSGFSDGISYLQ